METFKETLRKIWYILYPFLFYYAVMLIIMTIAQWAFGGDATHYVFCQLIATVLQFHPCFRFIVRDRHWQGLQSSRLESAGSVSVMRFLRLGSWHALEFL